MATAHTKQQVWDRKTMLLISARMSASGSKLDRILHTQINRCETKKSGCWSPLGWLLHTQSNRCGTEKSGGWFLLGWLLVTQNNRWDRKIRWLISAGMSPSGSKLDRVLCTQNNRWEREISFLTSAEMTPSGFTLNGLTGHCVHKTTDETETIR